MRIAISGRPLAGRRLHLEILQLHELIQVWHSAGDEIVLIHPPDPVVELHPQATPIHLEAESPSPAQILSAVWGDTRRAAEAGAEVYFIPEPMAPLVSPLPVVAMLSARLRTPTSFSHRIEMAIGRAGLRGASSLLTFDDMPPMPHSPASLRRMPAFVGSAFEHARLGSDSEHLRRLGLASGYCLAFGGGVEETQIVLAAWSWVAGALGDGYPLVIIAGGGASAEEGRALAVAAGVNEAVRWIEDVPFESLPALFRGADVCLNAGLTSTGQELRWSLACGVPVAGIETPETASVVGEAGYLVPAGDTRALGAACLTLIVETDVAEKLREIGRLRARAYHEPSARLAWADVFRSILEHGGG